MQLLLTVTFKLCLPFTSLYCSLSFSSAVFCLKGLLWVRFYTVSNLNGATGVKEVKAELKER